MTDHLASIVAAPQPERQFSRPSRGRLRNLITCILIVGLGACLTGMFLIISFQSKATATVFVTISLGLACWPIAKYFPGTIEKGLLFAVAFTLTISLKKHLIFRTDHLGGAVGLRVSITDILLVLLLAASALHLRTNRKIRIEVETPILLAFLAYLGSAALSAVMGNDLQLGLFELSALVQAFLLFVFLRNYVNESRRFKIFVAGLLTGLILQSSVTIVQAQRPGLLNLSFLGAGEQEEDVLVDDGIALPDVALALSVPALYLTLSRSGWAGLAVAVTLAGVFWRLWKPLRLSIPKRIALGLIALVLTCGAVMKAQTILDRWSQSFEQSLSFRANLASTSWYMVKANPFLGVGLNSFVTVVGQYDQTMMSRIKAFPVHNILLLEFSETGMIGGLAFVVLWIVTIQHIFAAARRTTSPFPRVVALFTSCGIIGFFFADMTGFSYRIPIITSLVWAQVGIALCAEQVVPRLPANSP